MEDFIKEQKKANRLHTIILLICMICCIGIFGVVVYTAMILIPILNDVSTVVNDLKQTLDANLESLQIISDSIINQNVVGGLADGIQKINDIDIDTLNSAIKDLQDIVAPLAKTVSFFK